MWHAIVATALLAFATSPICTIKARLLYGKDRVYTGAIHVFIAIIWLHLGQLVVLDATQRRSAVPIN